MSTTPHGGQGRNPEADASWKIPKLAWIAISLAVTAEAVSNALRAYDLGTHLERFTTTVFDVEVSVAGLVLVFAAIAVSLSQTRAAWVALTPGDDKQRVISGIAAALLLAISISAMASHILSAQRAKSGAETQDSTGYTNAKTDYDAKAAEFETVKTARAIGVVDAAIEAFAAEKIDINIWNRTAKCTDISKKVSRNECASILPLMAERAQAVRKADLERQLPQLKRDMDSHKLTDAAGKGEVAVSWAWAWIMGIGVVMIATFGPVIFAKVEKAIPAQQAPAPAPAAQQADEPVRRRTQQQSDVRFETLVDLGVLNPGQVLFDKRGKKRAEVLEDGKLMWDGRPATIHQSASGSNGWQYWHYEEKGNLVPIDRLRTRIASSGMAQRIRAA